MKILILSINAGGGHIAAMNSLEQALKNSKFEVSKMVVKKQNIEQIHKILVSKLPLFYELLYNLSRIRLPWFFNNLRIIISGTIHRLYKEIQLIDLEHFDYVVSTHFILTEQLLRLKVTNNSNFKLVNYVPDFDHSEIHVAKYSKRLCNGYIVQSNNLYKKILRRGGKAIIGRYIVPNTYKVSKEDNIDNFLKIKKISRFNKNVVINGGALWTENLLPKFEAFWKSNSNLDTAFIFITGRNKEFYKKIIKLNNVYKGINLVPLPFLTPKELSLTYKLSDIIILASIAPATLFEIMSLKVGPILLARTNPGQEYFNKKYAVDNELVINVTDKNKLEILLKGLLRDNTKLNKLKSKSIKNYKKEDERCNEFVKNIENFFLSL